MQEPAAEVHPSLDEQLQEAGQEGSTAPDSIQTPAAVWLPMAEPRDHDAQVESTACFQWEIRAPCCWGGKGGELLVAGRGRRFSLRASVLRDGDPAGRSPVPHDLPVSVICRYATRRPGPARLAAGWGR